jgi:hypothetical protein
LTGQTRYLFPNISLALLFICQLPLMFRLPQLVRIAQSAHQQLERLDRQYSTPDHRRLPSGGEGLVDFG